MSSRTIGDPVAGVRVAGTADRARIVTLLSCAFADDPAMSYIFPDPADRALRLPRLFGLLFDAEALSGHRLVTAGGEASTLWRAPGRASDGILAMLLHAWPMWRALGGAIGRALAVSNAIAAHFPRDAARTVMIERDSAFLVQGGAQTTLPAAQARFERQRLGAFAYLLLAPAFVSVAGRNRLNAAREGYPPIALTLGRDGQIAAADYVLTAPAPGAPEIRQHFSFTGSVSAQGVRFPRVTTMLQDGRPSLRLTITDFSVELSPA